MKIYNFTQVQIYGSYINQDEVTQHMNMMSREGWVLIETNMIAPQTYPINPNAVYGSEPGSFNFFWERDQIEVSKVPQEDEKVRYWKENLRRKM